MVKCKVFENLNEDEINKWLAEQKLGYNDILSVIQCSEGISCGDAEDVNVHTTPITTTIFYNC